MQQPLPKSYPYKTKIVMALICLLIFGTMALFLSLQGATNDRGLVINGVIKFSETGATIFYWVLALFCWGFVIKVVADVLQRFQGTLVLEVTETSLRIPLGFFKKTITEIEYSDVVDFTETKVQLNRFFHLHTRQRKFDLNRAMMPSKEAYEEAKDLILKAVTAQREKRSQISKRSFRVN